MLRCTTYLPNRAMQVAICCRLHRSAARGEAHARSGTAIMWTRATQEATVTIGEQDFVVVVRLRGSSAWVAKGFIGNVPVLGRARTPTAALVLWRAEAEKRLAGPVQIRPQD